MDSKKRLFARLLAAALAVVGRSGPTPARPISENMELMGAIARRIVTICSYMDASQVASARCFGCIGRAAVLYPACSRRLLFARWP